MCTTGDADIVQEIKIRQGPWRCPELVYTFFPASLLQRAGSGKLAELISSMKLEPECRLCEAGLSFAHSFSPPSSVP